LISFCLIIVSFCEPGGGGMVGRFIILYIRRAGALPRRGVAGEGESGVPEEVPPQAPSISRPHQQRTGCQKEAPTVEHGRFGGPKREQYKGGPRRAAEREDGLKVGVGP